MPERVCLTPLPDQEIIFMATKACEDMDVRTIVIAQRDRLGFDQDEVLSKDQFSKIFSLRFLARLMMWRRKKLDAISRRVGSTREC